MYVYDLADTIICVTLPRMLFYKFEKYVCIESRSDEYVVLRKSGRSGGISWYGWMAILVVQLNRSNTDLKTVWKTISTYEGWLTSTLTRQASMLFCSAEKFIYMTT